MNKRFDILWNDFLEGELDAAGQTELQQLTTADPSLLSVAADRYQQHTLLGFIHRENPDASEAFIADTLGKIPASGESFTSSTISRIHPPNIVSFKKRFLPALSAAAVLLLGFILFRSIPSSSPAGIPTAAAPAVAQLILAEDCEWHPDFLHLYEGQSLAAGPIALKSGSAVLRFEGGAELVLTGDTRIDLLSGNSSRLTRGRVVVRADNGAEGFVLETPASEFVDLGTEFSVRVSPSGSTRLQVHEGKVSADSKIITAGHGLVFDDSESKTSRSEEVAADAPRFQDMIRRANPRERRDLMLAYEGFFMKEGPYSATDLNDGHGWAGPWRERNTPDSDQSGPLQLAIRQGKMNAPWPVRGGRLGALELPSGHHSIMRPLEKPIDLSKSGNTFISFMIADGSAGSSAGDIVLTLRSSRQSDRAKIGFGWAKSRAPLVRSSDGKISRGTRHVPTGSTIFCVGKISRSADGTDLIRFRCYNPAETLHFLEPAEWDVDTHRIDLGAKLDIVEITTKSASSICLDEIRLGPTWRSVVPLDLDKFQ